MKEITIWERMDRKKEFKHNHISDQIRLSKKFCKANGLYGAESHIKGFSGYVLEILTINYKSFMDLIKNASEWEKGDVIDVEKLYKNKKEVLDKLNKDKHSPLIVIDPVDKKRNAAAVLSEDKFESFISLCKKFMRNPSDEFFKDKKVDVKRLKIKNDKDKFLLFKFRLLKGKSDVVGSKVLKVFAYLAKKIEEEGFTIVERDWNFEGKILWYYVKDEILSEYKKHYGPPVKAEKYLEEFNKKWKGHTIYNDGFRVFVSVKRKHRKLKSLVKVLVKDNYLKENVKGIKFRVY